MHLNDLLFLLPKISFFPNLHPEMFPEYVFERGFTNSASFFTEKRGASFSQFPLGLNEIHCPVRLHSLKCLNLAQFFKLFISFNQEGVLQ